MNSSREYVNDTYTDLYFTLYTKSNCEAIKKVMEDVKNQFGNEADLEFLNKCEETLEKCKEIEEVDPKTNVAVQIT